MQIRIYFNNETEKFLYEMYDGPDGIDYDEGEFPTLGEVFEDIIKTRTLTSLHYR